jgi:hypothetical protein
MPLQEDARRQELEPGEVEAAYKLTFFPASCHHGAWRSALNQPRNMRGNLAPEPMTILYFLSTLSARLHVLAEASLLESEGQTAVVLVIDLPNAELEHLVRCNSRLIHQLLCSLHSSCRYSILKVLTRRRSLTLNRV